MSLLPIKPTAANLALVLSSCILLSACSGNSGPSDISIGNQIPRGGAVDDEQNDVSNNTSETHEETGQGGSQDDNPPLSNDDQLDDGSNSQNYTVSGRLSGLTEGSITLSLNGQNNLLLTNNGTFEFDTSLVTGNDYLIALGQTDTLQECYITSASGVIDDADVDNIRVSCDPLAEPDPVVIYAINAGGGTTSVGDINFSADKHYRGGGAGETTAPITNTDDDSLYQTERWGEFSYALPVDNGTYSIALHMVEFYFGEVAAGQRVFNVIAEGKTIVSNFDPQVEGTLTAQVIIVENIEVTDKVLDLEFVGVANNPNVAGIIVMGPEQMPDDMMNSMTEDDVNCDSTDLIICLDFEDSGLDGFQKGDNVNVIQTDRAKGGSGALEFTTRAGDGGAGYIKTFNVPGTHWGRLYYRIHNVGQGDSEWMHLSFAGYQVPGDVEARFVDTVQHDGKHHHIFNTQPLNGGGEYGKETAYIYQFKDEWVCMEWQFDSANDTVNIWRNGDLLADASGSVFEANSGATNDATKGVPDTMNEMFFGGRVYQSGVTHTGLLDNIAVGTERIGCF